jgi:hypothetical protein
MTDETWTRPQLEGLLAEFIDRTLPAAEWTHHAHLLVGMMLGRRLPPPELHPALRETIAAYNVSTGNQNTDTTGYHDSITGFYAAVLGAFARATVTLPLDEVARRLLESPLADQGVIQRAYAPETLKTVAARRAFLGPAGLRPRRPGGRGDRSWPRNHPPGPARGRGKPAHPDARRHR